MEVRFVKRMEKEKQLSDSVPEEGKVVTSISFTHYRGCIRRHFCLGSLGSKLSVKHIYYARWSGWEEITPEQIWE